MPVCAHPCSGLESIHIGCDCGQNTTISIPLKFLPFTFLTRIIVLGGRAMKWQIALLGLAVLTAGCTRGSLNQALGTPKNPTAIFADPSSKYLNDQDRFILADYGVLLEAVDLTATPIVVKPIGNTDMRRYLGAGYNLADTYCSRYFMKTDEAYRRRRFGRTLTNDVGTAVTTLLGLASAGESAVTALAATTGLADSAWRNYDDSFVISPELAVDRRAKRTPLAG